MHRKNFTVAHGIVKESLVILTRRLLTCSCEKDVILGVIKCGKFLDKLRSQ